MNNNCVQVIGCRSTVTFCAELQDSAILITQQPPLLHTSHFTAEVKGQLVVLLSQSNLPTCSIIPCPFLCWRDGEMGNACYVKLIIQGWMDMT